MAINGIGSAYSFSGGGTLASIRRKAEAIQKRVEAESAARKAEQEATGLIRNPDTGEMVELSSVSEETREKWEHREQINSISPGEAYILFSASDPNAEAVERSKALGAQCAKIQDKMLAGEKLTGPEKEFLQEHYPELAAKAARMEREAAQLARSLQSCKSGDEARQVYLDAKMRLMNEVNRKDGSVLFYMAALDKTYAEHAKHGSFSKNKIDLWA